MSSSTAKRLAGVVIVVLLVALGTFALIAGYLVREPGGGSASAVQSPTGTHLYLGTVAAAETSDAHPTWVSYYSVDANDQNWHHDTTYVLPAHSVVRVTIYQFDGQSGLRNPFIAQARGTIGGTFNLDGKTAQTIDPDAASHIFAIPELGVSVPLMGIADDAKNPCNNAPCPLSTDHHTISFSFRTPGKGLYRWQCFVPCAAGYMQGFGGPMQTVGYMDGYIKVV